MRVCKMTIRAQNESTILATMDHLIPTGAVMVRFGVALAHYLHASLFDRHQIFCRLLSSDSKSGLLMLNNPAPA